MCSPSIPLFFSVAGGLPKSLLEAAQNGRKILNFAMRIQKSQKKKKKITESGAHNPCPPTAYAWQYPNDQKEEKKKLRHETCSLSIAGCSVIPELVLHRSVLEWVCGALERTEAFLWNILMSSALFSVQLLCHSPFQ